MTRTICQELLDEFCLRGNRTYREAADLLRSCGFQEDRSAGGKMVWKHARGSRLVLPLDQDLHVTLKKHVERALLELRLLDE